MLDLETFLTLLYVMVDDFCRENLLPERMPGCPGRAASLSRSEVVTLALFSQLYRFASERDFDRFAKQKLLPLFPRLPHRTQLNRLLREHQGAILAFGLHLARQLSAQEPPAYECLDRSGVSTRWRTRRGRGWLAGQADTGYCTRLGFFHGLGVLTCVSSQGFITGIGIAPASAKDQPLADTFLSARHHQEARLTSAGKQTSAGYYLLDKGFIGKEGTPPSMVIDGGVPSLPPEWSARRTPTARAKAAGPKNGACGSPPCARLPKPFMRSCWASAVWKRSGPMSFAASSPACRQRLRSTTSASALTAFWAETDLTLLTSSDGRTITAFHTKRFSARRKPP